MSKKLSAHEFTEFTLNSFWQFKVILSACKNNMRKTNYGTCIVYALPKGNSKLLTLRIEIFKSFF